MKRTSMSFTSEAKWTPGVHPALFVDSTAGTWKAMVDTDEATWSVRGPDPDNEAHYASGEVTNADVAEGSALDLKGRIAAAKKQARAYIMGQIAAGGTKKTKAILEAEIAAALAKRNVGIAADAAVRFVRPGDRFRYVGDIWHVTRVGRGRLWRFVVLSVKLFFKGLPKISIELSLNIYSSAPLAVQAGRALELPRRAEF